MINYILQAILFQVFFLAIYDFFLSKETFFNKNRWYLLSTPILSFLIPFIKIPTFQKAVPQEFIVNLPEIFLSPEKVIQKTEIYQSVNDINYVSILFWIGVAVFSFVFLMKLAKIVNLIKKHEVIRKELFTLILLPKQTKAFSFFNFIFLGKEIPTSQQNQIIAHEFVHSKQKHSYDLLFFEFLKIMMWFNPMIYLYQKRITLIHEYISDDIAAKSATKEMYINNLLSNFFQVENIAFVNQFYKKTLIKKRIIMMKKNQSKKMNQLKYLVLIPVLASMLFYSSCTDTVSSEIATSKLQLETRYRLTEGKLVGEEGSKETYLDSYIGAKPPIGATEISFDNLSTEEQEEFNTQNMEFVERMKQKPEYEQMVSFKFYKMPNGRNASAMIFNFDKLKAREEAKIKEKTEIGKDVSFMMIDKAPTFPGCDSGDKACFSKNIQKHFVENFDADLPNTLGLTPGKKRVFIGFKVDKEGNVVNIQARAPHEEIKEEVIAVMNTLPKMIPGEQDGVKVGVKYSIPFVLMVE